MISYNQHKRSRLIPTTREPFVAGVETAKVDAELVIVPCCKLKKSGRLLDRFFVFFQKVFLKVTYNSGGSSKSFM